MATNDDVWTNNFASLNQFRGTPMNSNDFEQNSMNLQSVSMNLKESNEFTMNRKESEGNSKVSQ